MKKYFLLINVFLMVVVGSYSQYTMEYEDPPNDWEPVSPHKNIVRINSLSKLPDNIQLQIKNHFTIMLGNLSDYTTFYQGQIYDLEEIFKADPDIHELYSVVPKYELYFMIRDTSIGLIRYNLHLKLDEYGQILQVNWPRRYWNDKSKFVPRDSIMKYALDQANLKGYIYNDSLYSIFDKDRFQISFEFDHINNNLVWVFYFDDPLRSDNRWRCWNVLEIDWMGRTVSDEYPRCWTPYY